MYADSVGDRRFGYMASKQIYAAVASNPALVDYAACVLRDREQSEHRLRFAASSLVGNYKQEHRDLLLRVAGDSTYSDRVRFECYLAYLDLADVDYDDSELDEAARRFPASLPHFAEWIATQPELTNDLLARRAGVHLDAVTQRLIDEIKKFDGVTATDCHALEYAFIDYHNSLTRLSVLPAPRECADIAARNLQRLIGIPHAVAGKDAHRDDVVIRQLQYFALDTIQSHYGPLPNVHHEYTSRRDVEAVSRRVLDWWEQVKNDPPNNSRMSNLALAGYKTTPGTEPVLVSEELLRALRLGTPEECKAAADVLFELGICGGTVPRRTGDTSSQPDILLADAMIRNIAVTEAAAAFQEGRLPRWDPDTKSWTAGPRP